MTENMDIQPNTGSRLSKQEQADAANEQLKTILQELKVARKILARDWAQLTPRERSAHSRKVKDLEVQQENLLKELELLSIEMSS
jgi:acyl-CoA reductase-like NAD-dependent aldehyde dehydrogenase